jgi:hypothetical protein
MTEDGSPKPEVGIERWFPLLRGVGVCFWSADNCELIN